MYANFSMAAYHLMVSAMAVLVTSVDSAGITVVAAHCVTTFSTGITAIDCAILSIIAVHDIRTISA
jgi:hypothetical protein